MFQNPGGMQDFGNGFGGGFQTSGGFGSPSAGVDKQKKYRFQNITPVTAAHIQQMTYDGSVFSLGGNEISQVTLVGTIIGVEKSQTCTTYKVDDTTGTIMVKHWNSFESDEDQMEAEEEQPVLEEGTPIRVFAQVRSFQKNINLNALHIRVVEDLNEITVHMLECIKFKLVNEAKKLGNKMPSGGGGFNVLSDRGGDHSNPYSGNMGMDSVQTKVWKLIESCPDQAGMSITEIRNTLKGLNINQIKKALDFLSNEGHIYSTIDEEHFRSTS